MGAYPRLADGGAICILLVVEVANNDKRSTCQFQKALPQDKIRKVISKSLVYNRIYFGVMLAGNLSL